MIDTKRRVPGAEGDAHRERDVPVGGSPRVNCLPPKAVHTRPGVAARVRTALRCTPLYLGPVLIVLLFAGVVQAEPYLPPDRQLRNDIQLLADAGVLNRPVTTWPIPAGSVASVRGADLSGQPAPVRAAHRRVLRQLERNGPSVSLRASNDPNPRTHFGDQPVNRYEASVAWGWNGERLGGRLQANVVHDADDEDTESYLDGSYGALRLGNWLLSAGAQNRWWGPGWEGSLILTDNARPMPMVALERDDARPSELPVVRWLGPWNLTSFFGQHESNRDDAPRAKLFGMRFAFRPLDGLEVGLSRTAQWGGKGRPETARSFWNMLTGRSNQGDDDPDLSGGDANQFAGYDFRWASPVGNLPYAIYGQLIGIDEAGNLPYQYMGLIGGEVWWQRGLNQVRVNLEVADTTPEFHRGDDRRGSMGYVHSFYTDGYRYRGRVMGHSMDGEGLMISVGAQLVRPNGDFWHLLLRHTEQNRDGRTNRAEGVEEQTIITGVELYHTFHRGQNSVTWSAGGDYIRPRDGADSIEPRVWGSYTRRF